MAKRIESDEEFVFPDKPLPFDREAWNREYKKRPDVQDSLRKQWAKQRKKRREINILRNRRKRAELRKEGLVAYGGLEPCCMCECGCKENKTVYLDLDHVNHDGADHRRAISNGSSGNFYAALKKLGWPKDPPIRVLCCKCNIGRQRNGGQCPELGILDGKKTPTPSRVSKNGSGNQDGNNG